MKLATQRSANADGKLVVVSSTGETCVSAADIAPTMAAALDNWEYCEPLLKERYNALNQGQLDNAAAFDTTSCEAPLPRAWQWLDGSLFLNHGVLMQQAFHLEPIADADQYPLVYQGAGDSFAGPYSAISAPSEKFGVDFEGEFGVITGEIPLGSSADYALSQIRLIVLLNDISYRSFGPREMKTGFGFVQAKGNTAFAPMAVTPDELGDKWKQGRVRLPLHITLNGQPFGHPCGSEMHFGFHELLAHVAQTRTIKAGTVVGSGTVSNPQPERGQACLSELRAKEMIAHGTPNTPFLKHDDTVHMHVEGDDGRFVFGAIEQRVKIGQ